MVAKIVIELSKVVGKKLLRKKKPKNNNKSVAQIASEKLGRPVGLNESALKVQKEILKKKDKFLSGGQAKIDANKDGKISGDDFKILRARKKSIGGMAIKGFKKKTPIY